MSIKLLIGGSPCTNWSIAQKNNRETTAEGIGWELFKNYLAAKEKFKPNFFLYENNKSASQAIKDQIAQALGVGVDPMARFTYINSALVSAQNRQRFYVTNFGDIEQPEDRGILLKDILETGTDLTQNRKSFCMTASYAAAWNTIERNQRNMVAEPVMLNDINGKAGTIRATCYKDGIRNMVANRIDKRTCVAEPVNTTSDGKAQTIKAQYQRTSARNICCYDSTYGATGVAEPVRVGDLPNQEGKISGSQATRIYDVEGKSVNLVANGGGQGAKTGLYAFPIEFVDDVPAKAVSCVDGKTYTVYKVENGLITIKEKEYPIKLQDEYYIIRKLTVRECARLQTMPDDYCKAVSATQGYKALGNGWTAEVIIHLLNHALKDVPRDEEIVVLSMYDGIGTGRYCLEKMGFTNVKYHAYEIDKYPIQIALDNYPDIIEHGDAFAVREDDWKAPQTRSERLDELLGGAE